MSDQGTNVFALDLRTGGVLYGYKGIAGAVCSLAAAASGHLASAALDRYVRIHSTAAPPATAGQAQPIRGAVLERAFMTTVPTAVAWDSSYIPPSTPAKRVKEDDGEVGDDEDEDVEDGGDVDAVLEGMQVVEDESDENMKRKKGSKVPKRR